VTTWQIDAFLANLRRLWPDVTEEPGWRNRRNGTNFASGAPIGTINHHTVTPSTMSPASQINMVVNGTGTLPGPVYNVIILTSGRVHLVAAGPANHAGQGSGAVRNRTAAGQPPGATGPDTMNGNQHYFGIALQHEGTHPNYPARQIDAMAACNAAFLQARGFTSNRAIHHKEWSRRKIDLSWTGDLRGRVNTVMRGGSTPPPTTIPPPSGSWFDMATEAQLRTIVREEIARNNAAAAGVVWDTVMPNNAGGNPEANQPGKRARQSIADLLTLVNRIWAFK
jgi:hypothetical protein